MTGKIRTRLRGRTFLRPPCPTCRRDRWKTLAKGSAWQCRRCGTIREINAEHAPGAEQAVA